MGDDLEAEVDVLQVRVRERLATLRAIGLHSPGPANDDDRESASEAVLEATAALIDYEEHLPALLDRAPHRLSLQIVRWSGVLAAAVGASLAVAALAGWVARWWVLIALLPALAGVSLLRMPVHPPRGPHLRMRPGPVLVAIGACLITLDAVARLPLWLTGIGAVVLLAGLWHVARVREIQLPQLRAEDVRIRAALRDGSSGQDAE